MINNFTTKVKHNLLQKIKVKWCVCSVYNEKKDPRFILKSAK